MAVVAVSTTSLAVSMAQTRGEASSTGMAHGRTKAGAALGVNKNTITHRALMVWLLEGGPVKTALVNVARDYMQSLVMITLAEVVEGVRGEERWLSCEAESLGAHQRMHAHVHARTGHV